MFQYWNWSYRVILHLSNIRNLKKIMAYTIYILEQN